ncbi:MAG: S8 family peptidase, partial [Muribaculaceae bacterium]|nr:S8 family peptidase [Muribaculaceae bacterium]
DEVEYPYGVVYGTSMSTPIVAGAVAVWLQAKSTLTSADIKDILENSSLRDDYVENGDPERWGCGKLRIAEGLRYLLQNSGDPTVLNRIELNEPRLYPNPSDGAFVIDFDNRDKTELKIYSADGRLVYSALLSEPHNALNLQNVLARGMYLVQLRSENTVFVKHLIIR